MSESQSPFKFVKEKVWQMRDAFGNVRDVKVVERRAQQRWTFAAQKAICFEGQPGDAAKHVPIARLKAGDVFAETALIDGRNRPALAIAIGIAKPIDEAALRGALLRNSGVEAGGGEDKNLGADQCNCSGRNPNAPGALERDGAQARLRRAGFRPELRSSIDFNNHQTEERKPCPLKFHAVNFLLALPRQQSRARSSFSQAARVRSQHLSKGSFSVFRGRSRTPIATAAQTSTWRR